MVADIIIKERFSVIGKKGQGRSDSRIAILVRYKLGSKVH